MDGTLKEKRKKPGWVGKITETRLGEQEFEAVLCFRFGEGGTGGSYFEEDRLSFGSFFFT